MMDLLMKISKITHSGIEIKLIWCPAHVGIGGNELADECAKLVAFNLRVENLVIQGDIQLFK